MMNNIFAAYNEEESNENIKSGGTFISEPGIYTATGIEFYLYQTEWEGNKYLNCEAVATLENGATIVDAIRPIPKSNQTEATTDLLNYMHNIALVTDKVEELKALKAQFNALPKIKYTDKFKKEHDAIAIKVFANSKFKLMTYSEVSGSANGIFVAQRLTLNQTFRFLDNASLGEIKDGKEPGASYAYWSEDEFANCRAKVVIQYSKKRDEADTEVLEEIVEYLKNGNKLVKAQKDKLTEHWDAAYAKEVLSGNVSTGAVDTSDIDDVEDDDSDVPTFG